MEVWNIIHAPERQTGKALCAHPSTASKNAKKMLAKPVEVSPQVQNMMKKMNWDPDKGLGRQQQGITTPLQHWDAHIHDRYIGQGIMFDEKLECGLMYSKRLHTLVQKTQSTPLLAHRSAGCFIDKNNGKSGCAATRCARLRVLALWVLALTQGGLVSWSAN